MSRALPQVQTLQRFFIKDKIIHELETHRLWVERFMFTLGLISAGMAIPQIVAIYSAQDSSQMSLMAWSFYSFSALMWLTYGVVFKRPIVIRVQTLFLCTNLSVVISILLFR